MTNPTAPDHGARLSADLLALAPIGGRRRPAKVVEHPAFRRSRARREMDPVFTVIRVPVVALDRQAPVIASACDLSSTPAVRDPGLIGAVDEAAPQRLTYR